MATVYAAILFLMPGISLGPVRNYAKWIYEESYKRKIDPLLVTAIIYRESRFKKDAYSDNNWGLMQLRVSKTTHPEYVGRAKELFDPHLNIKLGVKILSFWKKYHKKYCKDRSHWWVSHYQWGRVIGNDASAKRVHKVYRKLHQKVGVPIEAFVENP